MSEQIYEEDIVIVLEGASTLQARREQETQRLYSEAYGLVEQLTPDELITLGKFAIDDWSIEAPILIMGTTAAEVHAAAAEQMGLVSEHEAYQQASEKLDALFSARDRNKEELTRFKTAPRGLSSVLKHIHDYRISSDRNIGKKNHPLWDVFSDIHPEDVPRILSLSAAFDLDQQEVIAIDLILATSDQGWYARSLGDEKSDQAYENAKKECREFYRNVQKRQKELRRQRHD
jgi:Skp family chaperone for outer membrane proteins